MAEKIIKERKSTKTAEVEPEAAETKDQRNEKLSDDVDDILDEIDEVLEENAEDFVRQYIQKGGQ